MMKKEAWGQLTILDLYGCKRDVLVDEGRLREFVLELCGKIGMKSFGESIVKRFGEGSLEGYSVMQFIETSSITIHCDEVDNRAFIDIFSCKEFDADIAKEFSED